MMNSTQVSYFTLAAYFEVGALKYFFFIIVMWFYVLIVCTNVSLVAVICMNRRLHEPMYLFLCSLCVNELYGSTGLFPFLLRQILSDIHTVSASVCFLQIYCVLTYGNVQFLNLAIMSYDRCLAICYPLQYHTRMTPNKTAVLIALIWLPSLLVVVVAILTTVCLQLCGNVINKVYCINNAVMKLACYDNRANSIFGMIFMITTKLGLVIMILYYYMKIFKVCFSGSKQTTQKAVSTCTPHLASLLNYSLGAFFEVIHGKFEFNSGPNMLRIFLSIYWLTCQPLFNPVVYGLNLTKIRIIYKNFVLGKS